MQCAEEVNIAIILQVIFDKISHNCFSMLISDLIREDAFFLWNSTFWIFKKTPASVCNLHSESTLPYFNLLLPPKPCLKVYIEWNVDISKENHILKSNLQNRGIFWATATHRNDFHDSKITLYHQLYHNEQNTLRPHFNSILLPITSLKLK